MPEHLRAIAAATSRTLGELLGRVGSDAIEFGPARLEEGGKALRVGPGQWPTVGGGDPVRPRKSVVAVPGTVSTTSSVTGVGRPETGGFGDGPISRKAGLERGESLGRRLSASGEAGPVDGGREDPLLPLLDKNVDRHEASLS